MNLLVTDVMQELGLEPIEPAALAGHEDNIGEKIFVPILEALGYWESDIYRKPTLSHAIVGEMRAPDYGIYRYQESPRQLFGMVADIKASTVALTPNLE